MDDILTFMSQLLLIIILSILILAVFGFALVLVLGFIAEVLIPWITDTIAAHKNVREPKSGRAQFRKPKE